MIRSTESKFKTSSISTANRSSYSLSCLESTRYIGNLKQFRNNINTTLIIKEWIEVSKRF